VAGNPSGAVYGTIAVAALLAAESARRETYPKTVAAVLVTLLLYWLAHSYAEFTGDRLQSAEKLTVTGLARAMGRELSILIGASVPLVAVLLWWVAGAHLTSAVSAAVWTAAAMIMVIEVVLGVRAELSGRELVVQVGVGALLGLLVIALRLLLH
jgi:hypothetical protein